MSLSFLALVTKSNDLDNVITVELFKASSHDNFLMVLFSIKEAGFFKTLTVKCISVLKDLAYSLCVDVLCEYNFALLLDGAYIETISQR